MASVLVLGSLFNLQRFAEEPPTDPKPAKEGKDKDGAPAPDGQPADDDILDLDDDDEDGGKDDALDDNERAELDRLRGELLTPEEKAKLEVEQLRKRHEKTEAQLQKYKQQEARREIAARLKVPERVVIGTTKAEMVKSAKDWSETAATMRTDIEKQVRAEYEGRLGKVITPETPKTPEGAPIDDLDKKIREASEKGDVSTVTRLTTQKLTRAKSKAAQ